MDTARVCFEGTLEKTSGILKNKTKVWMVLHDLTLTYYKNNKRSSCIGSIDMVTVQSVIQKKTMGGGKKFEIITATNSYHFEAETSELCEAWVSVLHKSLALKSATPGSEINILHDKKGTTLILDDMSSSASGKQRTSSSTFYDELDAIPSSPTVFGVKLKSTRQSRKSLESMSDKSLTPSSPVSPISPRAYADKNSSKFSFSHTKKTKIENNENEIAVNKLSDSCNYGLKGKSHDTIANNENRGEEQNILENNDSGDKNEVGGVTQPENRKAEVAQVPEIAEQEWKEAKETVNEATDISLISSKYDATYDNVDSTDKVEVAGRQSLTEINKHVTVKNVRDLLPTLHHENSSTATIKRVENNTHIVANNVAHSLHSGEFNKDTDAVKSDLYEGTKATSDNTVEVMEETLKMSFKQNENESDTSEKTDANSNNIHMKANYTENEPGTDSQFDSEKVNDDVSHVQMRIGKANDNERNISNQYSDVDLSQVEMRKSSRSRSRGSCNTASEQVAEAEARNTEVSAKIERLRSLKGSISLEDSQSENTEYSQTDKNKNGAEVEYNVNEKSSRKLDNLSSLCLNGDLDEPVFFEEVSSAKQKQSQLRLDAYTKLKSFIEQADKNYDIEQHRKCTAFAAVSLEKVLKDI